MTRRCAECGTVYDDATSWTLCPHNPIDVGADTPYCREHDLFRCPFHGAPAGSTDALGRARV